MFMDTQTTGAQIAKLWRALSDQRDMVTRVTVTLTGADGTNGLVSRVRAQEEASEKKIVRLHERVDALMGKIGCFDGELAERPTYDEMNTAIRDAIAQNGQVVELAIERALKRHTEGNWAQWAQLIASVGTLVTVLAALAKLS
jgi:hypothetical protein